MPRSDYDDKMYEKQGSKIPIRPRKKGIDFGFSSRKTIVDRQNKCDALFEKKSRKKRDLMSEINKKQIITKKRHSRRKSHMVDDISMECQGCEFFEFCEECDCEECKKYNNRGYK